VVVVIVALFALMLDKTLLIGDGGSAFFSLKKRTRLLLPPARVGKRSRIRPSLIIIGNPKAWLLG